jgi:hypothetical protein
VLSWTGGVAPFAVFRSTDPSQVTDPGNVIGTTGDMAWLDAPPAGDLFFYIIQRTQCSSGSQCPSGFCADAVCCDTACSGACETCDLAGTEGICTPEPPGTPDPLCGGYTCDEAGSCRAFCDFSDDCAPGYSCNDGVCAPGCAGASSNCDGDPSNGCECSTPSCCGAACQTSHSNGLGQRYYDCNPLGIPGNPSTYKLSMAQAALMAWPVTGTDGIISCGVGLSAVYREDASSCAVWVYTGALAGYVRLSTGASSCSCPTTSDRTWN